MTPQRGKGRAKARAGAKGSTRAPGAKGAKRAASAKGPKRGPSTKGAGKPPPRQGARSAAARRRRDEGAGGEQVEGRQAVRELLLAGRRGTREILIALDRRDADAIDDIATLANELGVPVREVPMRTLDRIARTDAHQGVVASADPLPDVDLDDLIGAAGPPPFLLMLDGVTDPGNVGALLRTAECAGITGVVLPRHRAAHVTPAVAKAAAGAAEHLPISLVGGIPAAIAHLRANNVWVVGLDMGGTTDIGDLSAFDGPVALVLGAEGRGLSRLVRERVDVLASIPMHGRLGSLNVAAAGAIACYELARRRRGASSGPAAGESGT